LTESSFGIKKFSELRQFVPRSFVFGYLRLGIYECLQLYVEEVKALCENPQKLCGQSAAFNAEQRYRDAMIIVLKKSHYL